MAEQLGFSGDDKLLVVHMDDIGMSHSINMASMITFEKNSNFSGSIMVPCPWFLEIAEYARKNPQLDFGIHLTLTSEWKFYKWGGISSANEITTLLNKEGYFYATNKEVAQNDNPDEVEKEIRAQIEKAISYGIKPTHIDIHMGSILGTPELTQIYFKVAGEYGLPIIRPDAQFMLSSKEALLPWIDNYRKILDNVRPGLNVLIVHVGIDNPELQSVTVWDMPIDHPNNKIKNYGSAWRQRDFDYLGSEEFRHLIKKNNITLVTWREIHERYKITNMVR